MRCREVEKNLSAHLDGELAAAHSARIAAHLGACASCDAQAKAFSRLDGALAQALPRPEPSASFDAGLRAKLEAARLQKARASQASPGRRWFSWPLLAGATAAAAAAVLVVVLVGRHPVTDLPARRTLATAPRVSDLVLAQNLELLQNFPVVKHLDALEDFEAIRNLDRAEGAPR